MLAPICLYTHVQRSLGIIPILRACICWATVSVGLNAGDGDFASHPTTNVTIHGVARIAKSPKTSIRAVWRQNQDLQEDFVVCACWLRWCRAVGFLDTALASPYEITGARMQFALTCVVRFLPSLLSVLFSLHSLFLSWLDVVCLNRWLTDCENVLF